MTEITARLGRIQKSLKAPKDKKNTFGNYNFRNAEQILEAVKALLQEGEAVTVSDDIVTMGQISSVKEFDGEVLVGEGDNERILNQRNKTVYGDRFYIKATASFCFGKDSVSVTGFAREPMDKKGMDASQITGATSSYAKKYALSGLFAIDDSKDDPDAHDNRENPSPKEDAHSMDNQSAWKAAKSFQSDLVNRMALCKSVDELEILLNNEDAKIQEIKMGYPDLYEAIEHEENSIREGGVNPNPVLKFASVADAARWAAERSEYLDADLDISEMALFEDANMPYLISKDGKPSVLDQSLSAEKYKKDGKTPSQRIIEKFKFKLKAIQGGQI